MMRPQLVPVVAGNPVDMDQLEALVEQGQFKRRNSTSCSESWPSCATRWSGWARSSATWTASCAGSWPGSTASWPGPLVEEALGRRPRQLRGGGAGAYLEQVAEDMLDNLDQFREVAEAPPTEDGPGGQAGRARLERESATGSTSSSTTPRPAGGRSSGRRRRPTATCSARSRRCGPTAGEWETDHTRIKGGSLLRANGGFLVLDAMDVLIEAGVWAALKRTLRNEQRGDPVLRSVLHVLGELAQAGAGADRRQGA